MRYWIYYEMRIGRIDSFYFFLLFSSDYGYDFFLIAKMWNGSWLIYRNGYVEPKTEKSDVNLNKTGHKVLM